MSFNSLRDTIANLQEIERCELLAPAEQDKINRAKKVVAALCYQIHGTIPLE